MKVINVSIRLSQLEKGKRIVFPEAAILTESGIPTFREAGAVSDPESIYLTGNGYQSACTDRLLLRISQ